MSQPKVELKDLGLIDYKECWDYQTKIFEETVQQKISNRKFPATKAKTQNYLLFCEHPHVYTLGKSGDLKNLLIDKNQRAKKKASFYKINMELFKHGPNSNKLKHLQFLHHYRL